MAGTALHNDKALKDLQAGRELKARGNFQAALRCFKKAIGGYKKGRDKSGVALTLCEFGEIYYLKSEYAYAVNYLDKAQNMAAELGDLRLVIRARRTIGIAHRVLGNTNLALQILTETYESCRKAGDRKSLHKHQSSIGSVYTDLRDYKKSLYFHKLSLRGALRYEPDAVCPIYNNIALVYGKMGDYKMSLKYYYKALELVQNAKGLPVKYVILHNIANIYELTKKYKLALKYYSDSLKGLSPEDFPLQSAVVLSNLGSILMKLRRYAESEKSLLKGLKLAVKIDNTERIGIIYDTLQELYIRKRSYSRALEFHRRNMDHQAKILKDLVEKKYAEIQSRAAVERVQLQNQHIRQRLQYRNRELAAMARNLAQKNDLIASLQAHTKKGTRQSKDDKDIFRKIDDFLNTKSDWAKFRDLFEEAYDGLLEKLHDKYPSLTRQELRICALACIGLSTSMIARAMFLSQRSIENHRYRLRQKLGLSSNDDLAAFLNSSAEFDFQLSTP